MTWPLTVNLRFLTIIQGTANVLTYPLPTCRQWFVRKGLHQLSGNHRFKTPKRLALLSLKQLLQSTVYSQGKLTSHMARQLKSMSHHNTIIAQSASDRASRMPPWQSSDNFQVSEHHPILRVELTLHNTIAGLRKAVRPAFCETSKWVHGVRTADRC
jgi:hypothetical protein